MTNENCLAGIYCPDCGQEGRFYIDARVTCLVTDDGVDESSDPEWDSDTSCRCGECDRSGPLSEYTAPEDLPPDPESMNHRRAAWAGRAVAAFREATGTDEADSITDLVCDLMHWCDRHEFDFEAALLHSRGHYAEETTCDPTTNGKEPV